jgi:hypothetical protein
VTGTAGFDHPACQEPYYVMNKLVEFHKNHNIDEDIRRTNLERATAQLPPALPARKHPAVNAPRKAADGGQGRGPTARLQPPSGDSTPPARSGRGHGPKPLSAILPEIRKRLGGDTAQKIESIVSGETP